MTNILPVEPAKELCLKMMDELDTSALGKELREPGRGRMLGVLVCTDGTVFRAYSGEPDLQTGFDGFVPPVFDESKYRSILSEYDGIIHSSVDHRLISRQCWEKLKALYIFNCFDGLKRTLDEVIPNAPSGTGDCCAPRLLSYAYGKNKEPLSLCEFFYGSGTMEHKSFCTPCDARCKPILPAIIGLDIIYQDSFIVVANKPSGMLSIEGKGEDKMDCIASRVRRLYPSCIAQPCIHRLDQATSGLMVLGLTKEAHDKLSSDFENRRTYKEYEALADGLILEQGGTIDLPLRLDVNNRPHQIVDHENGKSAVTEWHRLSIENRFGRKVTRLKLIPKNGRTHQLRVHCASGLLCPIVGDALYGDAPKGEITRLMLQARVLEFDHPITGERLRFELEAEF